MKNKLGIIIPYRNRPDHLTQFLEKTHNLLLGKDIDYEIIVVEQVDNKPFNRGKLLNIGFRKTKTLKCSYVIFHDVDMLPVDVDYNYSTHPLHLASNLFNSNGIRIKMFDEYFGGVTLFPSDIFESINGFSNGYWGWGFEDDDLLYRCIKNKIKLRNLLLDQNQGNIVGLEFNGYDSKVIMPKEFSLKHYTLHISVEPKYLNCDPATLSDEYSIITLPGYDTTLSYNSFKRYKYETWTTGKDLLSLNSNIISEKHSQVTIVHDSYRKSLKMYVDGNLHDELIYQGRLMSHANTNNIIIGQPSDKEKFKRPFRGTVDYFAFWNHSLEPGQISSINKNLFLGLNENFEGYTNSHSLLMCYDMKTASNTQVVNLSCNRQTAQVHHSTKVLIDKDDRTKRIHVPFRRDCSFLHLDHSNNGFENNKWKYNETRINQLRYYNQVKKNLINTQNDGLSSLKYNLIEETYQKNHYKLSVKL